MKENKPTYLLNNINPKNIALVHDWFISNSLGGSEQVTSLLDSYLTQKFSRPQIYALTENISNVKGSLFYKRKISTSFLQNLPIGKTNVQNYLPLIPFAIEQLDFRKYDLIISSSHIAAKGVLTSPNQLHISYVHTPMRYAWDQMNTYLEKSALRKFGLELFLRYVLYKLREWDFISGRRPDLLIANSTFTSKRISKYWGLKSEVIHPPVNIDRFNFSETREDFYLSVCRLVPNKRIDLLIEAFNKLKLPLKIVGDGPELSRLKRIANKNIIFYGKQPNNKVEKLMSKCRAFIYPGIEDFGIAPVEAMASGSPIIAFGSGGILDTVKCITKNKDAKCSTGILFNNQTSGDVVDTLHWFNDKRIWNDFDPQFINFHAQRFSTKNFLEKFNSFIIKSLNNFSN